MTPTGETEFEDGRAFQAVPHATKEIDTMMQRSRGMELLAILGLSFLLVGCFSSAPPSSGSSTSKSGTGKGDEGTTTTASTSTEDEGTIGDGWKDYPDVPYVPIMTEIDGVTIPRLETEEETLQITGEIPADVGNEYAKEHPGKPTTGDWLIVRFNSEPKTLNPITETSAVQSYISQYVNDGLAWQNPESLEYEPHIATKWVVEDSVKLNADYKGKERRVALADGPPQPELEVTYKAPVDEEAKPEVVLFRTMLGDGQPLGKVWVGLYPAEDIPGAPTAGYHFWSDAEGNLEVSEIVPGKYRVRVGAELFGVTEKAEDGSLTVTPETPGNPLLEELKSSGAKQITLTKDDYVDVQRETYYTYFLRDDVTWSDGKPFTTKDIEFAYAVINNEYVDGESIRIYYQDLIECNAIDAHTVRMKYRQQYFKAFEFTYAISAYAPPWHVFERYFKDDSGKQLTLERLTPEQEEAQNKVSASGQVFGKFFNTDDRYNLAPLGTGPYIVDQWVRADRVEIRRNAEYWHPTRGGHLDRIVYKFIPDNVTALQALKAGEIDFLYRMEPEQYFEDLAGPPDWFEGKYVKASWYSPSFGYVGWNMLKPIFQDRRVRVALSLLFDVRDFVEKKLHNEAVIVSGSQYYFGTGYDHKVKPLGYDPDVARQLLADAGWVDTDNNGILDKDGKPFKFTIWLPPGNPTVEEQVALIQKSYEQAGIQMEIRDSEWASFIEKIKSKDYDACRLGWASPLESDPFQIWHGSQAGADKRGSNHVSFNNPEADALIEMLRLTLDIEKRKRIHWSFQRILDREQPYLFLYTSKEFGAYHKRFQGVKWYRIRPGFDFTEWYVPKDQQIH